ncbi:MAG: MobA/MobL family protein [Lachnospiraceae bacterium]|nr:MobA/MobL family protein [Lachnospiraceae bacterium]
MRFRLFHCFDDIIQDRIDHRSHAERGLDEQPTIHEGVTARALERKGIVSERCELNRQIKTDNRLLKELKAQVKKLAEAAANTIPAIAEKLENIRARMVILQYHLLQNRVEIKGVSGRVEWNLPLVKEYQSVKRELKAKQAEGTLSRMSDYLEKLNEQQPKLSGQLTADGKEFRETREKVSPDEEVALLTARAALRTDQQTTVRSKLQEIFGRKYNSDLLLKASEQVDQKTGDDADDMKARRSKLYQEQEAERRREQQQQRSKSKKQRDFEL